LGFWWWRHVGARIVGFNVGAGVVGLVVRALVVGFQVVGFEKERLLLVLM
jgi:hypothetical protein